MCGIVAAVGPGSAKAVEWGMRRIAHRGIRSRISEVRGGAVGHVRLPIVGLGEEHDQPVRRWPWTTAFVGEIHDFKSWRHGIDCDLDLVVETWSEYRETGFGRYDGFWHVVSVDERDGTLHVLVDYLAQKPVYYRTDGQTMAVASEPDALAWPGRTTLDEVYLSAVVKWGYCPETRRTPYEQVLRMLPGEYLHGCADGVLSLRVVDDVRSTPVKYRDLAEEVERAVKNRVVESDVPVACLVSGGLDSAIVYTLASRYGDVRAYHAENGEQERYDEVAKGATEIDPSGVDLDRALEYMQEPLDLGSLTPQVGLSDAIARAGGERVCLTGDGADELFGGYGRAARYDSQASDVWHELVAWHLPRLDRVMMRNRIEVRSPFLSRWVAGIALGLSREERTDKRILRDAFRGALPPGVADRPKRPLRTREVAEHREERSLYLVELFKRRWEEKNAEDSR